MENMPGFDKWKTDAGLTREDEMEIPQEFIDYAWKQAKIDGSYQDWMEEGAKQEWMDEQIESSASKIWEKYRDGFPR